MEMSCPNLPKVGKEPSELENGPNVTSERQPQDDSPKCKWLGQETSAVGVEVLFTSFPVFLLKHQSSGPMGWLSTATIKHFWTWEEKVNRQSSLQHSQAFCRHPPTPASQQGGKWTHSHSGGEGRDRRGFKLSKSKITPSNPPGPVGVLWEVSAQPGICKENFRVDKSALISLA